jgi:hypothetical protein
MKAKSSLLSLALVLFATNALAQNVPYQLINGNAGSLVQQSVYQLKLGASTTVHNFEIMGNYAGAEFALNNFQPNVSTDTILGMYLFRSNDSDTGAAGVVAGLEARAASPHTSTYHQTDLVFRTSNSTSEYGAERMRLHYDGNLTIGTSTHSAYKLDVNGTVRAAGFRTEAGTYPNVIGGLSTNSVGSGRYGATIAGGGGGGLANQSDNNYTFIGGGAGNNVGAYFGTVSGGLYNQMPNGADYSTIAGGYNNLIRGYGGFIGGGLGNTHGAYANYSVIGGGYGNTVGEDAANTGTYSVIGGGQSNSVTYGHHAVVGGGYDNHATSNYDTVPGGYNNVASGGYSFAAGHNATAGSTGSFVWSDSSSSCMSSTLNQFKVCATGGAWFSNNVSALSYTDRTPYPYDLKTAYEAVLSMRRLPDGQYSPDDPGRQLDHASLTPFVRAMDEDGSEGRNLSATVSAQNEVIKDLVVRINQLEQQLALLQTRLR